MQCDGTSIGNNTLNLKAGTNVSLSRSNGEITINSSYSDTWRPVEDNLSSTSTSNSLSANQGRVLNEKFGSYLPLAGGAMNNGARISANGGNLYIGNSNNAGWLMVQDICSQEEQGDGKWSLRTNGNAHVVNLYASNKVSAASDARFKEVVKNTEITVEQIAQMPSVIYRWKDREDKSLYAGTLAQSWEGVLPEVVSIADDKEHTRSFSYGVAALVSAIQDAREIVALKKEIRELKAKLFKERIMIMVTILAIIALAFSVIAVVVAFVKGGKTTEVVKEQKVIYAPVEHPFTYNEKEKSYYLDGSLKVKGQVKAAAEKKGGNNE